MPITPLRPHDLRVGDRVLPTSTRCLVMGVLNVTPDSFSDGGRYLDHRAAVAHGLAMVAEGADLIDVAAEAKAPVVLVHMQGTPATMQDDPYYVDVVGQVERFLAERCDAAEAAGVPHDSLVVDPGIGFGKRDEHNYALLDELARFTRLGHPVLVGTSRKGFIGRALALPQHERVEGTAATVVWVVERGQVFVIDLDLALDLEPAGRSDELDHTIDYGGLTARVAELVAGNRRQLLEAVAADVADLALADQRVEQVRVRVTKPHAPLGVDAEVAVEVVRGREVEYR